MFGADNSPGSFGHAGAHSQIAWADPASGISFAFVKNGLHLDLLAEALDVVPLSNLAAALT
jgi:CubicO group peptidase (beta-lactamase class C family)